MSSSGGPKSPEAYLQNGSIDLNSLRDAARKELVLALESLGGSNIALVLDPELVGPLGLLAEASLLKEHGVSGIYTLGGEGFDPIQVRSDTFMYIVRPQVQLMRAIAEVVHTSETQAESSGLSPNIHSIHFVPRKSLLCDHALAECGVYGDVETAELKFDWIPYDEDTLTMGMNSSFRSLCMEGDLSNLYFAARGILTLQKIYGEIPFVYGKGTLSKYMWDLVGRLEKEEKTMLAGLEGKVSLPTTAALSFNGVVAGEIDTLIILDRNVDMVTPLLTQMTYEGLVDEIVGIKDGYIDIRKKCLGMKDKEGNILEGRIKLPLNGSDSVFRDVRDIHFNQLGPVLKNRAARIAEVYEERHTTSTISAMSDFMKKFKNLTKEHTLLQYHINLADTIAVDSVRMASFQRRIQTEMELLRDDKNIEDYLEECIGKQEPLTVVLRLLVLFSTVYNGLKPKKLEFFKREILQTYGYDKLVTLRKMEQVGLLRPYQGKSWFSSVRKAFKVCPPISETGSGSGVKVDDISAIFDGYAPLSVRLIQYLMEKGGWKGIPESAKLLSGVEFFENRSKPLILESQETMKKQVRDNAASTKLIPNASEKMSKDPVALVVFLGGVTYAEAAALRLLGKSPSHGRHYVIATTHFTNGSKLMSEIIQSVDTSILDLSSLAL